MTQGSIFRSFLYHSSNFYAILKLYPDFELQKSELCDMKRSAKRKEGGAWSASPLGPQCLPDKAAMFISSCEAKSVDELCEH